MKPRTALVSLLPLFLASSVALAQPVTNPRTVTVSPDGSGANFSSIEAALNSITTAGPTNRYVILAYPGTYSVIGNGFANANLRWKSYVSLRGVQRDSTVIRSGVSCTEAFLCALIDASGLAGVEFSNITFDGSALLVQQNDTNGSITACGADLTLNNVLYKNAAGTLYGNCLSTQGLFMACDPGLSKITLRSSEILAPVFDLGGDWTILGSRIHFESASGAAIAFQRGIGAGPGRLTMVGSTVEAVGKANGLAYVLAVTLVYTNPLDNITGSTLVARSEVNQTDPAFELAPLQIGDPTSAGADGGALIVEGSTLQYESVTGATGGTYVGLLAEDMPNVTKPTILLRNSSFRSLGSGGTRADILRESTGADVSVAGLDHSTVTGPGASAVSAGDFRQGKFSADLTAPTAAPTSTSPANGQVWVDGSNSKFCWRSAGQTLCVAGAAPGGFMKVARVGLTSASGNLVCKKQGPSRKGEAQVVILNRDTAAPISGATVTGNWTGAAPAAGVTATTDSTGLAVFTSGTAAPGSVFTFSVTNVQHAPDAYAPASNDETTDSTPVCN